MRRAVKRQLVIVLACLGIAACTSNADAEDKEVMIRDDSIVGINFLKKDGTPERTYYAANPVTIVGDGRLIFTEKLGQREDGNAFLMDDLAGRRCQISAYYMMMAGPVGRPAPAYTTRFTCRDLNAPSNKPRISAIGTARGFVQFDWAKREITHPYAQKDGSNVLDQRLTPDAKMACSFAVGKERQTD